MARSDGNWRAREHIDGLGASGITFRGLQGVADDPKATFRNKISNTMDLNLRFPLPLMLGAGCGWLGLRGLGPGVRVCGWGLGGLGLGWAGLGCGGAGVRGCGSGLAASSEVNYLRSHLLQAGGCRRGGPKTCTPWPRGVLRALKQSEHIVAF
jgi:hypothetical protein